MRRRSGIKEIAEHLQVSKASCSFVLNGKARQHGISVALETRILEYAKEIGYEPNSLAIGLRTGKSKIIGMLVEDIADPFFATITRVVETNAAKHGYRVIYGSTENQTNQAKDLLRIFRNHRVDGYIIAPPPGIAMEVSNLIKDGFPVVIFDRSLPGIACSKVLVDNFNGVFQAVEQMVHNSFKKIIMVTLASRQDQMMQRMDAYTAVMKKHHLPKKIKAIPYNLDKITCMQLIKTFLTNNPDADAVFFATNYLALSGLGALKELKLSIGNDIGVLVFDDSDMFDLFNPSITAIAQPVAEIGATITNVLLGHLLPGRELEYQQVMLKTELVPRASSNKGIS